VTQRIQVGDIAQYDGQEVELRGWVYNRTGKGKLHFIKLRDGTGIAQCVAFKAELPEDQFELAKALTQESSIIIRGTVRADERAPGIPGGYEVGIKSLEVIQAVEDYPITPKEHGVEFLMDHRHLWLRSSRQWAILRIRATLIRALRNWLDDNGYLLVDTPIITPSAGEDTTSLFEIDYFDEAAYLAQTGQLYNEANIMAFGKVYCFGPTFRAEKSKTRRHLTEFWMVEPEVAFLEWMKPIFVGGHWTPQMIRAAGGRHSLNEPGAKSRTVEPEDLIASMPDRLIICPCGFTIEQTRADLAAVTGERWWPMLPAVQDGNVVIVDGDAMFNRPGPRLVDAFRWLVGWLNDRPELIPDGFPVERVEG